MENIKIITQELKVIEKSVNELTRDFIHDYLKFNTEYWQDELTTYLFDYKSISSYEVNELFEDGGYNYEQSAKDIWGDFENIEDWKRYANYEYLYNEAFNYSACEKYVELLEKVREYKQELKESEEVA